MATKFPKVTIITPSYNQGRFVEATILSVLGQTYPNIEYILVDGGSTDDTMAVVDRYQDRIDVVIHEPDRGQSDAINKGFRLASGELVGWINSDDVLYPDCVASIVDLYHRHPGGAVYYGAVNDWIDAQGRLLSQRYRPIPDRQHLLRRNYDIIQQGSFYPASLVRRVGYLNESIHYCMDLDLWLRLLEHGPVYALTDRAIAGFRRWEDTKTSTGGRRFLHNIQVVLRAHGAPRFARTVLKTRYQALKLAIKQTLTSPLFMRPRKPVYNV